LESLTFLEIYYLKEMEKQVVVEEKKEELELKKSISEKS